MDVTYPLARYSALITDLAALVGGAGARLDRLASREARASRETRATGETPAAPEAAEAADA
jgi:hypothetical protein